jgi:hypothetical protein
MTWTKTILRSMPEIGRNGGKMKQELNKESVKKLLDHWIEHNESHSASFRDRAVQVAAVSEKASQDVIQAAALMDQCTEMLKKAMKDL